MKPISDKQQLSRWNHQLQALVVQREQLQWQDRQLTRLWYRLELRGKELASQPSYSDDVMVFLDDLNKHSEDMETLTKACLRLTDNINQLSDRINDKQRASKQLFRGGNKLQGKLLSEINTIENLAVFTKRPGEVKQLLHG